MPEKISLIIPCKNEIESLGAVLNEIKNNEYDLVVCCAANGSMIKAKFNQIGFTKTLQLWK